MTSAARSGAFRYLSGTFTFEGTAGGTESFGYLAQPLPNTATTSFTPYLTATVPGSGATGVLAGVYTNQGRERLAISFAYHYYQVQFRHLAHGIVDWVTKGVHLGYWRNYFGVHIDDVFDEDASWSTTGNCTPGGDTCPPGTPDTTPIRMTAADVRHAADWQRARDFTLDMLFNGGAQAQFEEDGADPMFDEFRAQAGEFRWLNHTYTHQFLGCVQDHTVAPWRCQRDAQGNIAWLDNATITNEIRDNIEWAGTHGFPINPAELVAGEHSGTMILPQQPVDNPNFVAAVGSTQIRYVGLDASREPTLRRVGAALGVPRHPINVFYNVSTEEQEVDLYNWIYTSRANGGSGLCENNPATTCVAPLDPATGWGSYVLPLQVRIALSYVLRNDPQVFYMHQSNLTDDRLAYPVIEGVLAAYRSTYANNAPLVNVAFASSADDLSLQQSWGQTLNAGTVSGYVQANTVVLTGPAGTRVPITAPNQTILGAGLFGTAYGGETSAHVTLGLIATPLVMLAAPYGLVSVPSLPALVAAVAPNIVDAPHIAIDPGAGLLPGPPYHRP